MKIINLSSKGKESSLNTVSDIYHQFYSEHIRKTNELYESYNNFDKNVNAANNNLRNYLSEPIPK